MITGLSWKHDNSGIDTDKNGTIDLQPPSGILLSCVIDNSITFNANGSGTVDEGATKCNATDPQTSPFTWSFASGETALNINSGSAGINGQFKILELSNTKLSISKDTTLNFFSVALVVNFKH